MATELTEEELQKSAVLSADNADYESADSGAHIASENAHASSANGGIQFGQSTENEYTDAEMGDPDLDGADGDEDGSGEEWPEDHSEGGDVGGEDDDVGEDGGDAFDYDADDVITPTARQRMARISAAPDVDDANEDEGDADEEEGVGAVKIKPGETDEEDEEGETDNLSSERVSDEESDDGAEWEAAAENGDDEDSDAEASANCMFCKQNEENDPSEEFEVYLVCKTCGEHAHQQCAREAVALNERYSGKNWTCPDCAGADVEIENDVEEQDSRPAGEQHELASGGLSSPELSPGSRRSTAPKLARDLLPSQRGGIKPDSHSVFNQLVLDGDPLDGSRLLRKRKSSSAEAEEHNAPGRKRRRADEARASEKDDASDNRSESDVPTRPSTSRTLRLKVVRQPAITIQKRSRTSLIIAFRVKPAALRRSLDLAKEKKRASRGSVSRSSGSRVAPPGIQNLTAPFVSTSFSQPFYSFFDKETDELRSKPYGGILAEAEADTSKTLPAPDDRRRFDEAKQKAENQWRERIEKMQADVVEPPVKKTKKSSGPASQIECIEFGGWEIDTWYAAPYPEEYSRNRVLYICEFCLKYMNSDYVAWRHKLKCPTKHPPGDEIYRHGSVSVFEVDGRKNPVYCQNLCLLAKLFLGSKTLYYDVEPFLFYVLCEYDEYGYHFVGYFSKEKRASSQNNVSCILTLPIHQRKGYGNLLIDFSYLLTRVEKKTGSPEKPLSDMGLVSYRNYWRLIMCRYLLDHVSESKTKAMGLSMRQISDDTGLTPDDVVSALEGLRCLVRDPHSGLYAFRVDVVYCRDYVTKWESKNYVKLDDHALTWTPYVMGRGNAMNFELGPAITAIAPREEDDDRQQTHLSIAASVAAAAGNHLPLRDGGDNKLQVTTELTILESTEGIDKENGSVKPGSPPPDSTTKAYSRGIADVANGADEHHTGLAVKADDWFAPYADVPAYRFQVYPPIGSARRPDRNRPSVIRPTVSRTASSSSRPRRSAGSSKRPSASRPKSGSSSKRKSGGTGRGPGRWPKGTKKSDYGNADSGPGLPPAWIERNRLAALGAASSANGLKDSGDAKEPAQTSVTLTERDKGLINTGRETTSKTPKTLTGSSDGSDQDSSDDDDLQESGSDRDADADADEDEHGNVAEGGDEDEDPEDEDVEDD